MCGMRAVREPLEEEKVEREEKWVGEERGSRGEGGGKDRDRLKRRGERGKRKEGR